MQLTRCPAPTPAATRCVLASALVLLSACGDPSGSSGGGPPTGGTPALILSTETATLDAIGAATAVTATVNGSPVQIGWTLLSDSRWNTERAVTETVGGQIRAVGAGTAVYQATAAGTSAKADTLTVTVRPTRPYVVAAAAPAIVSAATPLLLTGYGLGALPAGAVTAGAAAGTVTATDSAHASVVFPAVAAGVCAGATGALAVAGADVPASLPVVRRVREGEMTMEIGEARALQPADLECLKMGGAASAQYALAYYDTRYAYAMTEQTSSKSVTPAFTLTLTDRTAGAAAGTAIRASASAAQARLTELPPLRRQTAAQVTWQTQTTPLRVGAVFEHQSLMNGVTAPYRVLEVIDGYLTLAAAVDTIADIPPHVLAGVTDMMRALQTAYVPQAQALFRVRPAAANGQLLVFLTASGAGSGASGRATDSYFHINVGTDAFSPERIYYVLAHEITHTYDFTLTAAEFRTGVRPAYFETWHVEGLADFQAFRAVAERTGLGAGRNLTPAAAGALQSYGLGGPVLESGYMDAAAFGLDLTWRLAQAKSWGWSTGADTIALAMRNNRWGCNSADGLCTQREGLYDVLRRLHGASWDPADAVLTYVLSQAGDEVVQSPVYVNPDFAGPHNPMLGPQTSLTGGSGSTAQYAAAAGQTGWHLLAGAGGAAFRVTSTAPGIRWKLLRLR